MARLPGVSRAGAAAARADRCAALVLVVARVAGGGTSDGASRARRLHQFRVWAIAVFVEEDVEGLLVDASFGELDFGVLLVSCVDNRCTADLGNLFTVAVECPAADFVAAYHILYEQDAAAEPQ